MEFLTNYLDHGLNSQDPWARQTSALLFSIRNDAIPDLPYILKDLGLQLLKNPAFESPDTNLHLHQWMDDPTIEGRYRAEGLTNLANWIQGHELLPRREVKSHLKVNHGDHHAMDINIYRRIQKAICEPNSTKIRPEILHLLGISANTLGNIPDSNLSLWTDGSKMSNPEWNTGFAVWSHSVQAVRALPPGTSVFTAEARAILLALQIGEKQHLQIFSDSQSTVDLCNKLPQMTPRDWLKIPQKSAFKEMLSLLQKREQQGLNTNISHICAHLLDKPEAQWTPEELSKWQRLSQTFGIETKSILQGNQKADALAKKGTQTNTKFPTFSPYMDQFVLQTDKGQIVDGCLRPFLRKWFEENQRLKLLPSNLGKTAWYLSAHPASFHIYEQDYKSEALKLFAYKASQGRLPTKSRIHKQNPQCHFCKEVETSEHILIHCKWSEPPRWRLLRAVSNLLPPNTTIPCWFFPLEKELKVNKTTWTPSTIKPEAAAGVIPKTLKGCLPTETAQEVHLTIIQHFHDIWTKRNKAVNTSLHPPQGTVEEEVVKTGEDPKPSPPNTPSRKRKSIFTIQEPDFPASGDQQKMTGEQCPTPALQTLQEEVLPLENQKETKKLPPSAAHPSRSHPDTNTNEASNYTHTHQPHHT